MSQPKNATPSTKNPLRLRTERLRSLTARTGLKTGFGNQLGNNPGPPSIPSTPAIKVTGGGGNSLCGVN